MSNWQHINFFDKNGKYYNFEYDTATDMWTGDIFLKEVSVNLFEVGQLFILQKFFDTNTNTYKFGFPHSLEADPTGSTGATGATGTTGSTGDECSWLVEWETEDPSDIFLFQFNLNFNTGTQSALVNEQDGPKLELYDSINVDLDYDPAQTIDANGYLRTSIIRSEAIQINFAINSDEENTFKRTLVIKDTCTGTVVGKFVVYAETVEEDERLKTMTENFGYNVISTDSGVFKDTNLREILPDYIEVNRKRKEIMLEGHNIYPFIGSYKGLVNAIKFFGYDNLQIREFWKNVNKSSPRYGKYIQSNPINAFDPNVNFNDLNITLPNKNFRKTSMFSLIYKINKIKPDSFDIEDLPLTEETSDYSIEEVLIKLFGLKRKLEKDFLPLNAHIKDIVGEGDYFGLVELTNTISRNDRNTIVAGIDADFKVTPDDCTYIEDLRTIELVCAKEEAEVGQAIVDYCNAFIAPFGLGNDGVNMLLGPIATGQQLPSPPIGPDLNAPFQYPFIDGETVTLSSIADFYLAYFSRYAPNLNKVGYEDGKSSEYLPDKPDIPVGALAVLENTSFGNLTWDTVDSTWQQLSNANTFYTFDFIPQGGSIGDTFIITDPVSGTSASYTMASGDTDSDVRDELYDQLITLKTAFTDPWVFWDISKETTTSGDAVRIYGQDVQRLTVSVIESGTPGAVLKKNQLPGESLYTWDSILRGTFTEIEWTVYKEADDVSGEYYFQVRGSLNDYERLPITLPYVGSYTVEMKLFDLYNNISSKVKLDTICVEAKEVDYSGWYQARKEKYTWLNDGNYKWNDYGSYWDLPIEPSVTWDEETPSLYESLDRVNAILNNFGLGTSPNFQLLNYQSNGNTSFTGPYYWDNLDKGGWNDTYHLWWDMTSTSGDTPAFFEFKEIPTGSYLKIIDVYGEEGTFFFDNSITTLADAAAQLNLSSDPIINKYVYNVVYDASNNQKFIQAVARYFGVYGDWTFIDMVDTNDDRVCESYTGSTGSTGSTGATGSTGCESIIYKKGLHSASNPTWDTAKFINEGKTLPKMTWLMFVYDKCRIVGKKNPRWTIRNTTDSSAADIYFESKYLTYLFKNPGRYEITLELVDTNGNKYKKGKNILIIK